MGVVCQETVCVTVTNEDEGPGGRDGVKGGCGRGEGKSET